jgi:glycosyltransferase involved in cell wall biosynthesis
MTSNVTIRTYCTYFDSNYLIKGLALIDSLNRWEAAPFRLFVVCLDELTRETLEKLDCPNVFLISLKELEEGDAALEKARGNRTRVEYYWTLTPTVILRFLEEVAPGDSVTYLDADLFFYSSPQPIFDEFAGHSALIHEHRFSPSQKHLEVYGKYNVGLLCFRRDDRGLEVLRWWQRSCNEWCYDRAEDGKYGDQLYLNEWPERYPEVRVLQHVGAGVAPWNNDQYRYGVDASGRPLVDGRELIFYHFHALVFVTEGLIVPAKHVSYPLPRGVIVLCITPYLDSLLASIARVQALLPDFSAGLWNKTTWGLDHTFVACKELAPSIRSNGVDHPTFDLGNGWECYVTDQMARCTWNSIEEHRPQAAQPRQANRPSQPSQLSQLNQTSQSPASAAPAEPAGIVAATSIAPKNLENQQAAIATWLELGIVVISANIPEEIEFLRPHFPGVHFVPVMRDAREMTGKPLVYFDDMLKILGSVGARVCGIINSDIHLRADGGFLDFLTQESRGSFIYGSRVNILSADRRTGSPYDSGFDFFFFDPAVTAGLYPETPFAIGATWWDYWAVIVPLLRNYPVKKLTSPVAFHIMHPQNWSSQEWHHLGGIFSGLLAEMGFAFSTVDLNTSVFGFLDHLEAVSPKLSYGPSEVDHSAADYPYQVSALIATCDQGKFLTGCLQNLVSQTLYRKGLLEIVIIDSGSGQSEEEVARTFLASHPHVVYQRTGPGTPAAAWNAGIRLARGKYLTHAHPSERHRTDAFELMARVLEENQGGLVYVDALMTSGENESFERNFARENWRFPDFNLRQALLHSPFGCQVMWRAAAHTDVGMFDPGLRRAGDYEFFFRLAIRQGALHLTEILALHHEPLEQQSREAVAELTGEVRSFISRYRAEIPLAAIYPYLRQDGSAEAHLAALLDFAGHLTGADGVTCADLPLAEKFYLRALELAPGHPEVLSNLAAVNILMGNSERARAILQSCDTPTARLQRCLNEFGQARTPQLEVTRIAHPGLETMAAVKLPSDIRIPRFPSQAGPASVDCPPPPPQNRRGNLTLVPPAHPGKQAIPESARPGRSAAQLPKISLVIPSYNYGRYLGACLDSILSQNYPNLELIVLDGGSADESLSIIKKHEKHLAFWRSGKDAGQYSAIEEGFQRSTGEIMGWLNADDMFHPGAFATVSGIFSQSPEIEWLMGRPNSFDEQGRQKVILSFLPMNSRAKYLADQELIQQEGVFWRRGLWERSGGYLDKELLLAADLELWARFLRCAPLHSVDCLIAGFRDHPLQKSKDKAAYTAEADLVLARERKIFQAERRPFSPPAPLPILVSERMAAP